MGDVETIIQSYGAKKRFLIPILQDIQAEFHYLPQNALRYVAERLRISLADVYGVATFYNCFSLKPRGKHIVRVCLGTTCHLKGGRRLVETLERELAVGEGEMTPDGQFTYDTVHCVGACSQAPLVLIDERFHPKMTARKVTELIKRVRRTEGSQAPERRAQVA